MSETQQFVKNPIPIPLDHIGEDPAHARTVRPSEEAEAAFRAGIARLGILQPLLVRPSLIGETTPYILIAGRRRLAAAKALDMADVPCLIKDLFGADALAAEGAENLQRAPMDIVDQWRLVERLMSQGYTLPGATQALGLPEAAIKQFRKLGQLAPEMLALMKGREIPARHMLAIIASAPHDVQKRAAKSKEARPDEYNRVEWYQVARQCEVTRIPQTRAIFPVDTTKIVWDEDLFAPAGDPAHLTTLDVKGFLKAQEAAVKASLKDKPGAEFVAYDAKDGEPEIPDGYVATYNDPKKTKLTKKDARKRLIYVVSAGHDIGAVHEVIAVPKAVAVEKAKAEKAKQRDAAKAFKASIGGGAAAAEDDDDAADKPVARKAGQQIIADAKTVALRTHIRGGGWTAEQLLGCFIAALSADNITVQSQEFGSELGRRKCRDLAARLVGPDGQFTLPEDLGQLAAEALARILSISSGQEGSYAQRSGLAAEWIGAFLGADAALPRFDTPAFLATCSADTLRRALEGAQIKPAKTLKAMREQAEGNLPAWRPTCFGAPGVPVVDDSDYDDEDEVDDDDAGDDIRDTIGDEVA